MNEHQTTRLFAGIAIAAFAAVFGHAAHAQGETIGVSRADVKQQARAANMAGQMVAGEEDPSIKQPAPVSTRTRAERKAQTLAANRNGGLGSPGQASYRTYNVAPREALAKSTKTRSEGQAETMKAIKSRRMTPAGEAA